MTEPSKKSGEKPEESPSVSWGPKLFVGVFLLVLAFFYWLLIYSGGAVVHHG